MKELTPRRIVEELDKYIVGQERAKRCVAIAIRNRWRRQQLPPELRNEVAPKNILMIGPTGVGKTEIARRLASLVQAPFLKIEASKYVEVGYHGRDVESMVRDLAELSVNIVRQEHTVQVEKKVRVAAEERLLELLLPSPSWDNDEEENGDAEPRPASYHREQVSAQRSRSREKLREKLRAGKLEKRTVELSVEDRGTPMVEIFSNAGIEQMGVDIQNMFERIVPSRNKVRKVTVAEAREILSQQEADKLIDKEKVTKEALERCENMGIIFIDEIDKIAGRERGYGPDVSREGVQRDLLPIVEGSTVPTRYGVVRTDHVLFIAAGAFNVSKPSDLIPELQGRFPIRVELDPLTRDDFLRILTEPKNALTRQYSALLGTENVKLEFTPEAIQEIAKICEQVNQNTQNIGARRLHTVMEHLVEKISFDAPELGDTTITVTPQMVIERLEGVVKNEDLSRYIL